MTFVVIWHNTNKTELNWIEKQIICQTTRDCPHLFLHTYLLVSLHVIQTCALLNVILKCYNSQPLQLGQGSHKCLCKHMCAFECKSIRSPFNYKSIISSKSVELRFPHQKSSCGRRWNWIVVRIFFVPIRICDDDLIKLQMLKRSGFGSTVVSSVPLPHLMAAIHSGKERSVFWVLLKKFLFGSNFIENMNAVHEDIHFSVKNVCRIA